MSFGRESLRALTERVKENCSALFRPPDGTPGHGLPDVFASVDAGIYRRLLDGLDFIARQIFPDTAEGEFLRQHWSAGVPPLHAATASGEADVTGLPGRGVPSGVLLAHSSGERFHVEAAARPDAGGKAIVYVRARNPGSGANLAPGEELTVVSAIPAGVDSTAVVRGGGIVGGADAETDEEYLARVLADLRNPARYGKPGDFAAWALDSTPEVSAAWEFRNFGVLGTVLVLVVSGNRRDGVGAVGGIGAVRDYIRDRAPPVMFAVRSPSIISVNPSATLPAMEDSPANRGLARDRMPAWMRAEARPGARITAGALRPGGYRRRGDRRHSCKNRRRGGRLGGGRAPRISVAGGGLMGIDPAPERRYEAAVRRLFPKGG